ncbi:CHAT domain-containing protein [Microseira wollei]|uniref:TPR repeat-containing protein n=2 Tax=Microseira wollei TaxID=467598 RepID=A0AAV3X1U5_9CYAN|nr:TPR repeat-containing protein [Microseira wollei NIES-4236]
MKRIISSVLALGICLIPATVPLMVQPSWGQSQNSQVEELKRLLEQAAQHTQQGQPRQAIEKLQRVIAISRQFKARELEATALLGIGFNYYNMGQRQQTLDYFKQALLILRELGDRLGEAAMLSNIGLVYDDIGQPQEALDYYNQALPILSEVGNRSGKAKTLSSIGLVYHAIGQPQRALEYYNQALRILQEVGDRSGEATTLNNIGGIYKVIEQPQKALDYYNQALPIFKEVDDPKGEAATLNNIGAVYDRIGERQKALDYYNQALPIFKKVGNHSGEATTLTNLGTVCAHIGQPQKALEYYNQALPILRKVGDRSGEATTLSNIGGVYRDTNRPSEAITYLEQSTKITLEIRGGLQRENRQKFLQSGIRGGTAIALISFLIDLNQPEKAFEWLNLFTTADLADYTRLIDAKVTNPQAQQAIDEWKQKNQQRQFLLQQLQNNCSEQLFQQFRALDEETNRQAEDISRRFPEVAELFETKPTDIAQLRASIQAGTVVIQPVLLTNIENVPNTVAIFVLTKDQLSVIKKPIDPAEFDRLFTQYREQLQNEKDASYIETAGKLYDILIRPVEDKIKAFSPKQLSIIATGKLRYIPFETLYDEQTDQFLIQKYPVNYLTRLSSRSLESNVETFHETSLQKGILALANPVPRQPQDIPGTEEEVKNITQLFPGSEYFLRNDATLEKFKLQAPRFPFLHLATHGCFQPEGCKTLGMEANTILFADRQFNIADAALLGLQNTQLLTLSACETAIQANSNGEEIAGVAYVFERAGAKGVMASLWNADDDATKELMTQFYQNLKQGMSKGEALQKAKLSQINRHPYFWSPFILIGDAR